LSDGNRAFDTMAGFRRAAHGIQRWAAWLGLLGVPGCLLASIWTPLPAWSAAAAGGLVVLSLLWAMAWRRLLERAFWRGARLPRRGRPVRLPLEVLALALGLWGLGGGVARAADPSLIIRVGEGRGLDFETLLQAAGIGGWVALGMGALALLVSLYLLFSLWAGQFAPRGLGTEIIGKLSAGDLAGARGLCTSGSSLLARSVLSAIPESGRPPAAESSLPGARIEAAGRRGATRWRGLVDLLAALGLLAPVAGLFGTVLGLVDLFALAATRGASSSWVAAGAVAALVPALVALGVSLLALTAHYLADLRLRSLVARCEAACSECAAALDDLARENRRGTGLTTLSLGGKDSGEAG
jgi:biopolymer transport protein ExbB